MKAAKHPRLSLDVVLLLTAVLVLIGITVLFVLTEVRHLEMERQYSGLERAHELATEPQQETPRQTELETGKE